MIRIVTLAVMVLTSLPPLAAQNKPKPENPQYFCYWMENTSGRYEWVPAEVGGLYRGEGYDRCFALDSCDGGEGQSAGGCYKWARSATAPRVLWTKDKNASRK